MGDIMTRDYIKNKVFEASNEFTTKNYFITEEDDVYINLGFDSLDMVELQNLIEEEFDIELSIDYKNGEHFSCPKDFIDKLVKILL